MRWEERGGPLVAEPVRKGFGHVVIGSMVGQATGGKSAWILVHLVSRGPFPFQPQAWSSPKEYAS